MIQERDSIYSCRKEIEEMVKNDDLKGLLYRAAELHGHLCPYLTYGVIAGYIAIRELGVRNTGMEEIIAIVETNNCFCDGIRVVTGCTFGNNALIFRDLGKTAVTVMRRDGAAVRIVLNPDFEESRYKEYPEVYNLWGKIVARKEKVNVKIRERLLKLLAEVSVSELSQPHRENV